MMIYNKVRTLLLLLLLFPCALSAQGGFYNSRVGTTLRWEIREGDGKLFGYCEETLVSMGGDAGSASILYSYMFYDPAGKSVIGKDPFEFNVTIADGETRAYVTNVSKAIKSGDYMAVGDLSSIPPAIEVGSVLADSRISIKLLNLFSNSNRYTSRKVTGREQVHVGAGTFDAFILEDMEYFSGNGPFRVRSWIVRDVGLVRQVIYRKDGTVNQVFELTQIRP